MAKEYIERDAALNASKIFYIEYIEVDGDGYEDGNADDIPVVFKKDIEAIPAADVRPVVHAKWIGVALGDARCSNCGEVYGVCGGLMGDYNFCPNCGADMREREET